MDARALASPNLTVLLAGNKADLTSDSNSQSNHDDSQRPPTTPSSVSSKQSGFPFDASGGSVRSSTGLGVGSKLTATVAPDGREVTPEDASRWASKSHVPVAVEVSALSGENVDEVFSRLARMILTKIELGEIDPDDPQSGIQYGDGGTWGVSTSDGGSIKSGMTIEEGVRPRRRTRKRAGANGWMSGMREWEEIFKISGSSQRRRGGCC